MKSWKRFEKQVASVLGGIRRVRLSYGEKLEDVYHVRFAVECKQGRQVPAYCSVKHPTSNGEFDLIPSKLIRNGVTCKIPPDKFKILPIKRDKFIRDGIAQAFSYSPEKIPVLCVKPSHYQGFVLIFRHGDYLRL